MLEKPDIPDERISSCLQEQYELQVAQLEFLPLGADLATAVYRVLTDDGTGYFLKLRKEFAEISVSVPLFLKSQGVEAIIIPFETVSKQYWVDFSPYTMILYPFIEGQDGFDRELTDDHRRILGEALNGIHNAQIPPELKRLVPEETFSPHWRKSLLSFQALVEENSYDDLVAANLAEFIRSRRPEIAQLIERTEELASEIQSKPLERVLCHTDIHGGNILISHNDELLIVDWDNPLLAPRERDLMFIGGGVDHIWKSEKQVAIFYEGYGETKIDLQALAYYRYERVIEDLVAFCQQLLLTDEGGADREQAYKWFTGNFEPGQTIEIATNTDRSSMRDG